jgi:hypothetical protein
MLTSAGKWLETAAACVRDPIQGKGPYSGVQEAGAVRMGVRKE